MEGAFRDAAAFNQDVGSWNASERRRRRIWNTCLAAPPLSTKTSGHGARRRLRIWDPCFVKPPPSTKPSGYGTRRRLRIWDPCFMAPPPSTKTSGHGARRRRLNDYERRVSVVESAPNDWRD